MTKKPIQKRQLMEGPGNKLKFKPARKKSKLDEEESLPPVIQEDTNGNGSDGDILEDETQEQGSNSAIEELFGRHEGKFFAEENCHASDGKSDDIEDNNAVSSEVNGVLKGLNDNHSIASKVMTPEINTHVKSMIKESESKILNSIDIKFSTIISQLISVSKELSEVKEMSRSAVVSKTLSGTSATKNSLNSRCDEDLENFSICFTEKILCRVMGAGIIRYLTTQTNKVLGNEERSEDISSYALCFSAIIFGKKANQSKLAWKNGVGMEASKLRKMIVLSALMNVQRNRFDQFEDNSSFENISSANGYQSQESASNTTSNKISVYELKKIRMPAWIGNVTSVHIEKARQAKESKTVTKGKSYSKKKSENEKPCSEDVYNRAAERLFSDITSVLHEGRSRGKMILFEELGYALTSWNFKDFPFLDNMKQPNISWIHPSSDASVSFENIPLTNCSAANRKMNEYLYSEFMKQCNHMLISVKHDVFVIPAVPNTSKNRLPDDAEKEVSQEEDAGEINQENESRYSIQRIVNLLDVSVNFLTAYCGIDLKMELGERLGTHELMIKASYKIALVLRELVSSYIKQSSLIPSSYCSEDEAIWEKKIKFEGISLGDIKSPPSFQKNSFKKMVTAVTSENFKAFNVSSEQDEYIEKESGREGITNEEEIDEDGNLQFCLL